jgi:diazepam-binding inhibitor (GABA receptor modulating acyl-CoA-binding protein)
MTQLKSRFDQAMADSKQLLEKPDNSTLLKIYALYKQASAGDVDGKRPGFADMVGRAKWDAWNTLAGTPAETAMRDYIDLIESLK